MTGDHHTAVSSNSGFVSWSGLTAKVMVAVGDDRIAVIRCTHDPVQLVAAPRPHFDIPELTVEIECQPKHVAVAQRPDLPIDSYIVDQRPK